MEKAEIVELLRSLRSQALTPEGEPLFGSHQLDAHWSLAFASDQSP